MAVQGLCHRQNRKPSTAITFWVATCLAGALSLAAVLVALRSEATSSMDAAATVEQEMRARNERIAFFEERAANDPLDYVSLNQLAANYLQRARESGDLADFQRAEIAAERSLAIVPIDNFSGVTNLAAVRIAQHDFASAEELARRALALKPGDSQGYGLLGDALMNLGRYDEAATVYDRMLAIAPALPALARKADLAWVTGDLVNAEDFWKQALRFDDGLPAENRAWAKTQLASFYFTTGDLDAAEREYVRALRAFPDYVHALAGLAAVRAAEERWNDAIKLYVVATDRLPEPRYVAALGDVYARAGRAQDAETQYALVEVIDRLYRANGINNDLQLARFYTDHDRHLEEALAMAENAYAASPGVHAADVLAWALYKNGRFEEAGERIDEALRVGTPDPAIHFHAANIKLALGDRASAAEHVRRLEKLNPAFSPLHADEVTALLTGGIR